MARLWKLVVRSRWFDLGQRDRAAGKCALHSEDLMPAVVGVARVDAADACDGASDEQRRERPFAVQLERGNRVERQGRLIGADLLQQDIRAALLEDQRERHHCGERLDGEGVARVSGRKDAAVNCDHRHAGQVRRHRREVRDVARIAAAGQGAETRVRRGDGVRKDVKVKGHVPRSASARRQRDGSGCVGAQDHSAEGRGVGERGAFANLGAHPAQPQGKRAGRSSSR